MKCQVQHQKYTALQRKVLYYILLMEKLLWLQPHRMRPQGALSLRLSSAALQQHIWLMTD